VLALREFGEPSFELCVQGPFRTSETLRRRKKVLHSSVTAAASLAAVLMVGIVPAQAVNLVVNGGFEQPTNPANIIPGTNSLPGWAVYSSIPGWTTVSGQGIEIQLNGTGGSTPPRLNIDGTDGGSYKVELDAHPNNPPGSSNSTMQQVLNLGKGKYELSFWYRPRVTLAGTNTNTILYSLLNGSDANILSGNNVVSYDRGGWREISKIFHVATPGSFKLRFAASGTADTSGGFIDNVSVSAVPVPPAALLLGGGMLGLVYLSRRRKAAQAA
jgi:hypothetical protein